MEPSAAAKPWPRAQTPDRLSNRFQTLILDCPPRLGEHPRAGHTQDPPDTAVRQIKDGPYINVDRGHDQWQSHPAGNPLSEILLPGFFQGGGLIEAGVQSRERPQRIPAAARQKAPHAGYQIFRIRSADAGGAVKNAGEARVQRRTPLDRTGQSRRIRMGRKAADESG